MKNFEQIAATPEALGAFLSALPVADGPWDAEFRRVFCAGCSAENCDGDNCPRSAERNNPLWWLNKGTAQDAPDYEFSPEEVAAIEKMAQAEHAHGQKNAAPGSKPGTAQRRIGTASATAAWKVLQAMGYVNETPFQETQDFLRKAQEILEIMKQAGIDPVYWESVLAMAATFDVHMRG